MTPNKITVLSLGAGVQSSALALMSAEGELPMVDCAIFADTGAESQETYDYLGYLRERVPYPIYEVKEKEGLTKMLEEGVRNGTRVAQPPMFAVTPEGERGQLLRVCTDEFKIKPVRRKIRELLGLKKGQRAKGEHCDLWMGISLDEVQRMRESLIKYIKHHFPLIDGGIRRGGCLEWLKARGYKLPPRSACVYCPYHRNHEWRRIRDNDKDGWKEAIRVDHMVRQGWKGIDSRLFVHDERIPLGEVDLSTDEDRGQMTMGFVQECAGMCGV